MAKYQLLLPKMGESVAEATIIKWNKAVGDRIEADETVMEIATDKVDSEVPSPVSGKLVERLCNENDVVQVGSAIAIIDTGGESEEEAPAQQEAPKDTPVPAPRAVEEPTVAAAVVPGIDQLEARSEATDETAEIPKGS